MSVRNETFRDAQHTCLQEAHHQSWDRNVFIGHAYFEFHFVASLFKSISKIKTRPSFIVYDQTQYLWLSNCALDEGANHL